MTNLSLVNNSGHLCLSELRLDSCPGIELPFPVFSDHCNLIFQDAYDLPSKETYVLVRLLFKMPLKDTGYALLKKKKRINAIYSFLNWRVPYFFSYITTHVYKDGKIRKVDRIKLWAYCFGDSILARWLRIQGAAHLALQTESQVLTSIMWKRRQDWIKMHCLKSEVDLFTCTLTTNTTTITCSFWAFLQEMHPVAQIWSKKGKACLKILIMRGGRGKKFEWLVYWLSSIACS